MHRGHVAAGRCGGREGLLAAIAVFSYLLGGLNGAIIASKYVFHRDVRDEARMRFVLFDCK